MARKHRSGSSPKPEQPSEPPAPSKPPFELELERIVDAPRERVFAAWSQPEAMTEWFAPKPFQLIVHKMDFSAGGRFGMAMRGLDGHEYPFTGRYREIVPPGVIFWSGEFSSGPADQISTIVSLEDEGRKTKVHVRQIFHEMTPEIKHATKGAKRGWNKTLDQLEEFCARPLARIENRIELEAPLAQVWRALTDAEEFGAWFRVKLEGPFALGQATRGQVTTPGFEHVQWKVAVKEMQPEKLFSYAWHPYAVDPKKDYSKEAPTLVEFRLKPTEGGTMLSVSESGFDGLPSLRRQEAFRMHEDGWAQQLKNIEAHLAQGPEPERGQKITPCLWFDDRAEEAAMFYVSVFKDAKILGMARYGKAGAKASGKPQGSVMTVSFQIGGQQFLALNGGPEVPFNLAISLMVNCRTQEEIDDIWSKLSADPAAEACGWLKDKFGVSWQIVPADLGEMIQDARRSEKVMAALVKMKKLDLKALQDAAGAD